MIVLINDLWLETEETEKPETPDYEPKPDGQQLEKLQEEIKKQQETIEKLTKKFEEQTENNAQRIQKLEEEKWVDGEYKWMPIDSFMPEGWTKVNLAKGWTLVQGDQEQETETTGMSKKHSHYFGNNKETASVYKQGTVWFYNAGGGPKDYVIATKSTHHVAFPSQTSKSGMNLAENNLAAGLYAELWQYRK